MSEQYICYRSIQPPTAIELSITAKLTNDIEDNLIVAKGTLLEIYNVHCPEVSYL